MSYVTPWSSQLDPGTYRVTIVETEKTVGDQLYRFTGWTNGVTTPYQDVGVVAGGNVSLYANFALVAYTTPYVATFPAGETHTVTMPTMVVSGGVTYNFVRWENNSTNPVRALNPNADENITAYYEPAVPTLVVDAGGPYSGHMTNPTVYFAGSASGGLTPYTWLWNFGDGSTSTLQNPTHTYASAGEYTTTLQVSDSSGQVISDTASVSITALLPPLALFTYTPASPTTGQLVNFNGSASHAQESGATITSYQWNFGDGATGSGATATHVYSTTGSKNVVLTVTDSLGQSDTEMMTIDVSAPQTWTLTVSTTVGGSVSPSGTRTYPSGQPSDPVTATRNSTYLFVRWLLDGVDVGDTNPYIVQPQTAGTSHTLQAIFTVAPQLEANAGGPYSAHITAPTVQFTGSATGGIPPYRTWIWNFGDGSTSTLQNPTHTYVSAGTYNVSLQVIDTDGQSAINATTATISNYYPPTANFSFTPTNPMVGHNVTFDGSSSIINEPTATIISYEWFFGDGSTGNTVSPTHVYASAGEFRVVLTVTDSFGSSNTTSKMVTVSSKPKKQITVQAGPNGSTNPSPTVYSIDYDVEFRVTAIPNIHYKFSYWDVDGVLKYDLEQVFPASPNPIAETHLLTAYFEILVWTLTAVAGTHGTVSGTSSGEYIDGTQVQLSAKPDDGYIFDYWNVNGNTDTANPLSLIMDKDYSATAYFTLIPTYTVAGSVKDATGAPVIEVRVSAKDTAYSTYTIADGTFILALPNGTYTIVYEKAGFQTVEVPNVAVTGNVQVTPVTILPTPALAGFPLYALLIAVPITALIFFGRPRKRGVKK